MLSLRLFIPLNMTPKEKAEELLDKMSSQTYSFQEYAGAHYSTEEIGWEGGKKCAIISAQEIIKFNKYYVTKSFNNETNDIVISINNINRYWNDVIIELEKL